MAKDQTKITAFQTAVASKLEQLKNKKNEITGDFTQDNTSYPTAQAVKSFVASVIDGLHAVATSGDYADLENTPVFDFVKQATAKYSFRDVDFRIRCAMFNCIFWWNTHADHARQRNVLRRESSGQGNERLMRLD